MTTVLMILAFLCVALVALTGWLFGKERRHELDIEKLYDAVAQLAIDDAKIRDAITSASDMSRDRYTDVIGRINNVSQANAETAQAMADAIAKDIEKKWDSGLQNMLAWNPFDRGESEDG